MEEWTIVKAQSGYDFDGFPVGEILCRTKKEAEDTALERKIENPVYTNYLKQIEKGNA